MGVLNVTPDSFSDGGSLTDSAEAVARGLDLWSQGADIVDVGGESTRPGADPISAEKEIERVVPVVTELAGAGVVVSIDTMKPDVARAAIAAGAEVINDVSGLRLPEMRSLAAETEPGVVIMHMRGDPRTMQQNTEYDDVVSEVSAYLQDQAAAAVAAGVDPKRVCIDPGIGFGKSHQQNLELIDRADEIISTGYPVLIGASRKGFLGSALQAAGLETVAAERDWATAATVAAAVFSGAAGVRVHNVAAGLQVARVADAIVRGEFENGKNFGRT